MPHTELRPCKVSRLIRAASVDTSSLEPIEPICVEDDVSDTPEVPIPAPDKLRVMGRGMFPSLGRPLGLRFAAWLDEMGYGMQRTGEEQTHQRWSGW